MCMECLWPGEGRGGDDGGGGGNKNVLELDSGDGCTTLGIYKTACPVGSVFKTDPQAAHVNPSAACTLISRISFSNRFH